MGKPDEESSMSRIEDFVLLKFQKLLLQMCEDERCLTVRNNH
jgi:hypothetical protein